MNSNGNENNNGVNSVSLGNIENGGQNIPLNNIPPMGVVPPMPEPTPVEPVENLDILDVPTPINNDVNNIADSNMSNSISQSPIPNVQDVNQSINGPVAPINYEIPEPVNNTMPTFNDIGTIPPIPDSPVPPMMQEVNIKPKKSGMNKLIFVIIVVLALTAVGVGVYILLNVANRPKVALKQVKIEVGSQVSADINDYATFTKMDSSACSLDTTKITSTSEYGAEYEFVVACGNTIYRGKAKIVDTVAPEVNLKEVKVGLNETVIPNDFISECKDGTECTYEFKDEDKVLEYLKEASSYHVPIIVKDKAGNEKEVTGVLVVTEEASTVYLVCSMDKNGMLETNKFGLTDGQFNKKTKKEYTFTFDNPEQYESVKQENVGKEEITYQNVTGKPMFDDDTKTLVISKEISFEDLSKEYSNLPISLTELRSYFEARNYGCIIGY